MITYKQLRELTTKHPEFSIAVYAERTVDSVVRSYYGCLNNDIISDNTPKENYNDIHITEFNIEPISSDYVSICYYWDDLNCACIKIEELVKLTNNKADDELVEFDNYTFTDFDIHEDDELIILNIKGELHDDAPIECDYEDYENEEEDEED